MIVTKVTRKSRLAALKAVCSHGSTESSNCVRKYAVSLSDVKMLDLFQYSCVRVYAEVHLTGVIMDTSNPSVGNVTRNS